MPPAVLLLAIGLACLEGAGGVAGARHYDLVQRERDLVEFGLARYSDRFPLLTWNDLDARGALGASCDPTNAVARCGVEFVCRQGICRKCIADQECPSLHVCRAEAVGMYPRCVPMERKAWEQAFLNPYEGLCSVAIFFAAALAAAAGTGGGSMFVPLLVALSSLSAASAVPLSQFMIFCGSIVNLSIFIAQRHPEDPSQPVIDYDCVVLFEPMLCLGISLGVICNQMSPQWLLLLLLCMTLGFALWRTGVKGIKQWKAESKGQTLAARPDSISVPMKVKYLDAILELTNRNAWQVVGTIAVWLVMLLCSCHGMAVCSLSFLAFMTMEALLLVVCTATASNLLAGNLDEYSPRLSTSRASPRTSRTGEMEGDEQGPSIWVSGKDTLSITRFPMVAFAAGFLGGLLGLGGGIILSPVLIEVGMHSEAVQATTALFVFLSSSLATIQFAMLGAHVWHYALWYGTITVLATIMGQHLCEELVRKHGRYSLITLAIAGVLAASLVALSVVGTMRVSQDFIMGRQLWFSSSRLCNSGGLGIVAVDVLPAQAWPNDLPPLSG